MASAWAAFVSGVWGAPEMRRPAHFAELARHPAVDLPPELAQVFLQGCSVTPGFATRIQEARSRTMRVVAELITQEAGRTLVGVTPASGARCST